MNTSDRAIVLAPSLILFIAVIGAIYRGSLHRSDVLDRYQSKIDLTLSGLSEKAVNYLRDVYSVLDSYLGTLDAREGDNFKFDPTRVVADPSTVREPIKRYFDLIAHRNALQKRFQRFLKVGHFEIVGGILLELGDIGLTAHFMKFKSKIFLTQSSWVVGLVGIALLGGSLAGEIYFRLRLGRAQELAIDFD